MKQLATHDIFLDQNHWIYLARALLGRPHKAVHAPVARLLLEMVESGTARLPLSFLHLLELLKAEAPERRLRLAEVFDLLSAGWFFAPWPYVLPLELRRAVAIALGLVDVPPLPTVIGRGFLFGTPPGDPLEQYIGKERLVSAKTLASLPGAIIDLVSSQGEVNRTIQKKSRSARAASDARATEEQRLRIQDTSPELRRRIKLAEYTHSHQSHIADALASYGVSLRNFYSRGGEFLTRFWAQVPSVQVDCELTLYRDKQWTRPVDPNDFADLGHLVLAIPYCSVVVAERFWARGAEESGVAEHFQTRVCTDLGQLPEALQV